MPVATKSKLDLLTRELANRYSNLIYFLEQRELKNNQEGLSKGIWTNPKSLRATKGDVTQIQMAVDDFKTILSQIKSLK
jgi:hypothetical protein